MSAHDDDRGGVPSASSMDRTVHCPSSFNFERLFRDLPSPDGTEGEFMHDVVMDFKPVTACNHEQLGTVTRAIRQRQRLVDELIGNVETRKREERIYLYVKRKRYCSGRYDDLFIGNDACLLVDYKFGRKDVPHAMKNIQLRTQACLVYWQYGYKKIYVSIISPRAGKPTVALYEEDELKISLAQIMRACEVAVNTNSLDHLNTGDWCQYCKARHVCPKAWAYAVSDEQLELAFN